MGGILILTGCIQSVQISYPTKLSSLYLSVDVFVWFYSQLSDEISSSVKSKINSEFEWIPLSLSMTVILKNLSLDT